jgi:hypothetical protein
MTPRYHINLFWSDEDDAWIADVPDLTYCSTHRPSPEVAWSKSRPRSRHGLPSRQRAGPQPEPRYRPAIHAVRDAA